MSADHLLETTADRIATLTLNRPDVLNAVTADMLDRLCDRVAALDADPGIGAIVLTGTGRAFCSGGDVKSMASRDDSAINLEKRVSDLRGRMDVARLLHEASTPTIAMLRGPAAGAGMSLALACDLRIASESVRIVTAFSRIALSGDFGGSWFMSQLVGPAKARELYLLSDAVDAAEALRLGLVNRVVADDALEEETMAVACRLASGPAITLGYMKKNLNAALTQPLAPCLDLEALHHSRCGETEDHREAARAFVEKREPVFKGQ